MTPTPKLIVGLLKVLDAAGVQYVIGGSFASSAWGRPRQTLDLDIAVLIDSSQAEIVASALEGEFMLSRSEMEEAILGRETFRSFQFLHFEELFKIDVFVLDRSEYTEQQMARRRIFPIASDYDAAFASPEDIVITKLRWFVLGNRISDKQWNDIVQVLEAQWQTFDFDYARRWCDHFGVLAEFEDASSQVVLP